MRRIIPYKYLKSGDINAVFQAVQSIIAKKTELTVLQNGQSEME